MDPNQVCFPWEMSIVKVMGKILQIKHHLEKLSYLITCHIAILYIADQTEIN